MMCPRQIAQSKPKIKLSLCILFGCSWRYLITWRSPSHGERSRRPRLVYIYFSPFEVEVEEKRCGNEINSCMLFFSFFFSSSNSLLRRLLPEAHYSAAGHTGLHRDQQKMLPSHNGQQVSTTLSKSKKSIWWWYRQNTLVAFSNQY